MGTLLRKGSTVRHPVIRRGTLRKYRDRYFILSSSGRAQVEPGDPSSLQKSRTPQQGRGDRLGFVQGQLSQQLHITTDRGGVDGGGAFADKPQQIVRPARFRAGAG